MIFSSRSRSILAAYGWRGDLAKIARRSNAARSPPTATRSPTRCPLNHVPLVDLALFIERRDRFGARRFPAARPNGRDRHIAVDHSDRRLDHRAAVVALRDDAVGMMRPIGGDRDFRPFRRLVSSGGIAKHIAVTLVILSHDNDAGFIGLFTRGRRGIDRNHNSRQVWRGGNK